MSSKHPRQENSIPLRAIRTLLGVALDKGYPLQELLKAAGFDFNPLERGPERVPVRLYSRLYRTVIAFMQDEAFGMASSGRMPPGTFRMMCRYVIHCENLRQVLVRMAEFFDFCDSFHQPRAERRTPIVHAGDGLVYCRFYHPGIPVADTLAEAHASMLYMTRRLCSWLVGQTLPLVRVQLPGEPDNTSRRYASLFQCPLEFGADVPALVLEESLLASPVVQTEASLQRFLRNAPYPLMTDDLEYAPTSCAARVRHLFASDFHHRLPTAEEIAERLHMSPRSLHRHLQQENTSFQQLKDEHRRDLALAYMDRQELNITSVSLLMGFQDPSAFHRSFKRWTGLSPGDYRRRQRTT